MNTSRHAFWTAVILAVVAIPVVHAAEVVSDAVEFACGKNHFILGDDCGGSAIGAAIGPPGAVATDLHGNVYFSSPNIVFRLDANGTLGRVAGNGTAGYSGDGGPATDALLSFPLVYPELVRDPFDFIELIGALAADDAGNLYIADAYNNRVRKVDTQGIIRTVAGNGTDGTSGEGHFGGQATDAPIHWPQGVAVDRDGGLYVADAYGPLWKVAPDGALSPSLASANCGEGFRGPGLCAPEGIAISTRGTIYVADGYCRVREVDPAGSIVTIAGADTRPQNGFEFTCGYSGDGGPARIAALQGPFGVAVDAVGNLYIADAYNNCIREVDTAGIIRTVAGRCGWASGGFAGDGGPATDAQFDHPHGVAVDAAGNLFIADTGNHRIRKVGADGIVTTVAGNGN